jgi:hypothetical protein
MHEVLKIIHLRFRSIACPPKVDILADLLVKKKKTSTSKMFDHEMQVTGIPTWEVSCSTK